MSMIHRPQFGITLVVRADGSMELTDWTEWHYDPYRGRDCAVASVEDKHWDIYLPSDLREHLSIEEKCPTVRNGMGLLDALLKYDDAQLDVHAREQGKEITVSFNITNQHLTEQEAA